LHTSPDEDEDEDRKINWPVTENQFIGFIVMDINNIISGKVYRRCRKMGSLWDRDK
jgi:hypothetical protein